MTLYVRFAAHLDAALDALVAAGDLRRVMRFHHMLSTAAYQVQHQILDPEKDAATLEAKTVAAIAVGP